VLLLMMAAAAPLLLLCSLEALELHARRVLVCLWDLCAGRASQWVGRSAHRERRRSTTIWCSLWLCACRGHLRPTRACERPNVAHSHAPGPCLRERTPRWVSEQQAGAAAAAVWRCVQC
jgi:hypothetical protein